VVSHCCAASLITRVLGMFPHAVRAQVTFSRTGDHHAAVPLQVAQRAMVPLAPDACDPYSTTDT